MEHEDAAAEQRREPDRRQDRRRLPSELTILLSGKQEQGLNHVIRRRILRAIHVANQPMSSTQLCAEDGALSGVSLSTVAYHMKVLTRYGLVSEDHATMRRGTLEHFFASEVSGDPPVLSVLAQTEELDAAKRDTGGED